MSAQTQPHTLYYVVGYSGEGDDFGSWDLAWRDSLSDACAAARTEYASGAYRWVDVEFDNERDFEFEVAYHVGETEEEEAASCLNCGYPAYPGADYCSEACHDAAQEDPS